MNKVFLLFVFILLPIFGNSQEIDKKLLYEDYDQFLNLVENINPQLEIRELITDENIMNTLRSKRTEIDSIILPMGSIIKNINGRSVESYFYNSPVRYHWDNIYKKTHSTVNGFLYDLKLDSTIVISYLDSTNKLKEFVYDNSKYSCFISSPSYLFYERTSPNVEFFNDENILYIRTSRMSDSDIYVDQIQEKGRGKNIKKGIWDIRRNLGGNDEVWQNILAVLIKDTLRYDIKIASMDTELANEKLEINKKAESVKLPFLKKKYKVMNWGESVIVLQENSIKFDGPIYILQDKIIYSSAGSLSALARLSDQLTTIGTTTEFLLGNGITPVVFQLNNTKFAFQLEPVVDITNIKESYDYYHDFVETPIKLTREDMINYLKASNETLYSKNFLYNVDPVFKEALEME